MNIKIFATSTCSKCKMVANKLEDKSIPHEYIVGEETMKKARELGVNAVPICEVDGEYKTFLQMMQIIREM